MVLVEVVDGVAVRRDCKGQLEVGAEEAAAVAFPSNRGISEEQVQKAELAAGEEAAAVAFPSQKAELPSIFCKAEAT